MNKEYIINSVKSAVNSSASSARYNAGMGGKWGDGGASAMEEKLEYWLDGIKFAQSETNETHKYKHIVEKLEKLADPDYEIYMRLKDKFEKEKTK